MRTFPLIEISTSIAVGAAVVAAAFVGSLSKQLEQLVEDFAFSSETPNVQYPACSWKWRRKINLRQLGVYRLVEP